MRESDQQKEVQCTYLLYELVVYRHYRWPTSRFSMRPTTNGEPWIPLAAATIMDGYILGFVLTVKLVRSLVLVFTISFNRYFSTFVS